MLVLSLQMVSFACQYALKFSLFKVRYDIMGKTNSGKLACSDVVVSCVYGGSVNYSFTIKSQSFVTLCPLTVTFTSVAGVTLCRTGDYRGLELGILHPPRSFRL